MNLSIKGLFVTLSIMALHAVWCNAVWCRDLFIIIPNVVPPLKRLKDTFAQILLLLFVAATVNST
jgi:hypothetical protein